jgi:hypothetical protein
MLVLGDNLLSLGKDKQLLVWRIGQYDAPEVRGNSSSRQLSGKLQMLAGAAGKAVRRVHERDTSLAGCKGTGVCSIAAYRVPQSR